LAILLRDIPVDSEKRLLCLALWYAWDSDAQK